MEDELTLSQIDYVATLMVSIWEKFARVCEVENHEIERIDIDHRRVQEKSFQLLMFIHQTSETGLKWSFVKKKLEECNVNDIIRNFEQKYPHFVTDCNGVTTHAVEESLEARSSMDTS